MDIVLESSEGGVGGSSGAVVGTLRAAVGGVGLAHMKLATALLAQRGQARLMVKSGDHSIQIEPLRPKWWPDSWGYEEVGSAGASDV